MNYEIFACEYSPELAVQSIFRAPKKEEEKKRMMKHENWIRIDVEHINSDKHKFNLFRVENQIDFLRSFGCIDQPIEERWTDKMEWRGKKSASTTKCKEKQNEYHLDRNDAGAGLLFITPFNANESAPKVLNGPRTIFYWKCREKKKKKLKPLLLDRNLFWFSFHNNWIFTRKQWHNKTMDKNCCWKCLRRQIWLKYCLVYSNRIG